MPDEVDIAIMAVREELMEYFKGDCVERFTERGAVRIRGKQYYDPIRAYWYERRERELASAGTLEINGTKIAEVSKEPAQLLFVTQTMKRSPQLRSLRKNIEKFMRDYLPVVEIGDVNA